MKRVVIMTNNESDDKTISMMGSIVLTVNNLMGPGMLAIPVLFQQAGVFPTIAMTLVFFVVASYSAVVFCEAIDILNVICNKNPSLQFSDSREFSNVVRFYFGDGWYIVSQLAFIVSLQSLNITSIIVSAQAVDNLLIYMFQTTYALEFTPHLRFVASSMSGDSVFPEESIVLSLGYVVLLIVFLPLGFLELRDNVSLQYVSFGVMACILMEFVWHFTSQPWHYDETPFVGENMTQLVGILAFSFAFTTLVPSWYNEKHPSVNTNVAIWTSTTISTAIFIVLGLLAGWAYPFIKTDNVLNAMSRPSTDSLTRICVFMFALGTVAPGIAVRSIMLRLNLTNTHTEVDGDSIGGGGGGGVVDNSRPPQPPPPPLHENYRPVTGKFSWATDMFTCSKEWAVFWGIIFPWLVSFIFYEGKGFAHLINWTSLTVNGCVSFILPFLVYRRAHMLREQMAYVGVKGEHFRLLGDGRQSRSDDDDDDGDESDASISTAGKHMDVFPPSLAMPSVGWTTADTLASVLMCIVAVSLMFQICVNLFYLVFAQRDILE